jgi:hypothetical protein
MELTKADIEQINREAPSDQGIFREPWGIPVHIKEPVVYMRWETGGMSGGNCWGDEAHYYESDDPKPKFKILDILFKKFKPEISYLQFREIEELIHTNHETQYEYYGNSENYEVQYILLSELLKKLESF